MSQKRFDVEFSVRLTSMDEAKLMHLLDYAGSGTTRAELIRDLVRKAYRNRQQQEAKKLRRIRREEAKQEG